MGTAVWVAIIGGLFAVISSVLTFLLQLWKEHRCGDKLRMRRMELIMLINHCPTEVETICGLYDQYRAMGGNSYMLLLYERWEKKYAKKKKRRKK